MAAHRYWRFYHREGATGSSLCGITEIELRTAAGGADVTGTGTASASSSRAGEDAAKAFDNNLTTTLWQMDGDGHKSWIKYDFGAGNEKDIVEVLIRPDFGGGVRTPREIDVQFSDDNSAWTTAWMISYKAWSVGTSVVFTAPSVANHRYWRLRPNVLQSGGQTMGCAELEMRSAVGGADQTGSGTAVSRTIFPGAPASNAYDNSTATEWSGDTAVLNVEQSDWLGYDFGSGVTKDIQELAYTARVAGTFSNQNQSPVSGWIESGADGQSWISRWAFSGKSYTSLGTTVISNSTARRRQIIN